MRFWTNSPVFLMVRADYDLIRRLALFPDQRVASFCTMTDMQRAEALQISRELTRRVVEAEGAALEAE